MKNLLLSILAGVTFMGSSAFAMEENKDMRGTIIPLFSSAATNHTIPPSGYCWIRLEPSANLKRARASIIPGDCMPGPRAVFYTEQLSGKEISDLKPYTRSYPQNTWATVPVYEYTPVEIRCIKNRREWLPLHVFYAKEGCSYTIMYNDNDNFQIRGKYNTNVPKDKFTIEEVVVPENSPDIITVRYQGQSHLLFRFYNIAADCRPFGKQKDAHIDCYYPYQQDRKMEVHNEHQENTWTQVRKRLDRLERSSFYTIKTTAIPDPYLRSMESSIIKESCSSTLGFMFMLKNHLDFS